MSDVKLCPNGHYYPSTEPECPYCPRPSAGGAGPTVPVAGAGFGSGDKTQIFNQPAQQGSNSDAAKTQVFNGGNDPDRTQIFSGAAATENPQDARPAQATAGRKLVAWLVTYDFNPLGRDYRLCEGRNTVGHAKEREVDVSYDGKVSSHHLTILYRLGEFLFKDELSTNGTFLNGVLTNEGTLKDGDELRIGGTTFLFRTATK